MKANPHSDLLSSVLYKNVTCKGLMNALLALFKARNIWVSCFIATLLAFESIAFSYNRQKTFAFYQTFSFLRFHVN